MAEAGIAGDGKTDSDFKSEILKLGAYIGIKYGKLPWQCLKKLTTKESQIALIEIYRDEIRKRIMLIQSYHDVKESSKYIKTLQSIINNIKGQIDERIKIDRSQLIGINTRARLANA